MTCLCCFDNWLCKVTNIFEYSKIKNIDNQIAIDGVYKYVEVCESVYWKFIYFVR